MTTLSLEETILNFYNVEGLKFGKFTMRTGEISPVYVDMRVIWTYPDIVVSNTVKICDIPLLSLFDSHRLLLYVQVS